MTKGQMTIGVALSVILTTITVGGIIFGFGGRIAAIESQGLDTKAVAAENRTKVEEALKQTAVISQQIKDIDDNLQSISGQTTRIERLVQDNILIPKK